MTIKIGDPVPDVKLWRMMPQGPKTVQSTEVLGSGRVVLFGVPGAFTPTCTDYHLPGFVLRADDLRARGVDTIACVGINDVYVMDAWGKAMGTADKVLMLADPDGEFTAQMGLELDIARLGLGTRSGRYAAIVEDGVVTDLMVEPSGTGLEVSSAQAVLDHLDLLAG